MLSLSFEMGRSLPDKGGLEPGKMTAEDPVYIGIVFRQLRADQLAVDPVKVDEALPFFITGQVKVAGAHAKGHQAALYPCIGPFQGICRHDGHGLTAVLFNDLEPAYILLCLPIEEDMGPVHAGRGMKGG